MRLKAGGARRIGVWVSWESLLQSSLLSSVRDFGDPTLGSPFLVEWLSFAASSSSPSPCPRSWPPTWRISFAVPWSVPSSATHWARRWNSSKDLNWKMPCVGLQKDFLSIFYFHEKHTGIHLHCYQVCYIIICNGFTHCMIYLLWWEVWLYKCICVLLPNQIQNPLYAPRNLQAAQYLSLFLDEAKYKNLVKCANVSIAFLTHIGCIEAWC